MYRKFKNPEISLIFKKILVLSIFCDKCGSNQGKIFKNEESIEMLKIIGLIDNTNEQKFQVLLINMIKGKMDETRSYFLEEIKHNYRKHKKVCKVLNNINKHWLCFNICFCFFSWYYKFCSRYDRDMFCELLSMKQPQTTSQNKQTTLQSNQKMLNKNMKKSPSIKVTLFNCTGEIGIDNRDYLNSSLCLFYFYFAKNLQKNSYGVRTFTGEYPPSPIRASTLSAGPPLSPSERTYFMDYTIKNLCNN